MTGSKERFGRLGTIGRFRPLHNGSALMLETLCEHADHVVIGIGSSNKYNMRNPFTADEAADMINIYLSPRYSNYELIQVPDFGHIKEYSDGKMWAKYVKEHFGELECFVTGNDYSAMLLKEHYTIVHPASLLPSGSQMYMKGSIVRMAIATGEEYRKCVPACVADYLEDKELIARFKKEFGLETLAQLGDMSWRLPEDITAERNHTLEN